MNSNLSNSNYILLLLSRTMLLMNTFQLAECYLAFRNFTEMLPFSNSHQYSPFLNCKPWILTLFAMSYESKKNAHF